MIRPATREAALCRLNPTADTFRSQSQRPDQRGSVSVLLAGVIAVAVLMAIVVADISVYLRGRAVAATAADAAALAAAPLTFAEFGDPGGPESGAATFAALNGATLVRCVCPVDTTWGRRTVAVIVAVPATLILFGSHTVTASSTAVFDPVRLPASRSP